MKLFGTVEKSGSLGVIISAMECAGCFPPLGALGATIGLGFLASFEGVLINRLLPLFAMAALLASIINWHQHQVIWRGILSSLGPLSVLLILYPFWKYDWSTYAFYGAIVLMLAVSIFDIAYPARAKICQI